MKKIGLIGGVGWRSTAEYYRLVNEAVAARRGGLHSAPMAIESLDFAQVRSCVDAGDEEPLVRLYGDAARRLCTAGAQVLGLCSNAAHTRIDALRRQVGVPFVHIGDPLCAAAHAGGFDRLGLLGTLETMTQPFMRERLAAAGFDVIVPPPAERQWLHETIFGVLEQGRHTDTHRARFRSIVDALADAGAQAAVLGCTELPLLLGAAPTAIPCLDTTALHAQALVDAALSDAPGAPIHHERDTRPCAQP